MSTPVTNVIKSVRALTSEERGSLFFDLLQDPELREDLLDLALVLQAEAESGEPVSLDDYLTGKRTYE